jgi:hypothetical protein
VAAAVVPVVEDFLIIQMIPILEAQMVEMDLRY